MYMDLRTGPEHVLRAHSLYKLSEGTTSLKIGLNNDWYIAIYAIRLCKPNVLPLSSYESLDISYDHVQKSK